MPACSISVYMTAPLPCLTRSITWACIASSLWRAQIIIRIEQCQGLNLALIKSTAIRNGKRMSQIHETISRPRHMPQILSFHTCRLAWWHGSAHLATAAWPADSLKRDSRSICQMPTTRRRRCCLISWCAILNSLLTSLSQTRLSRSKRNSLTAAFITVCLSHFLSRWTFPAGCCGPCATIKRAGWHLPGGSTLRRPQAGPAMTANLIYTAAGSPLA